MYYQSQILPFSKKYIFILVIFFDVPSENYGQISLHVGAETGTVDSGLPVPLVESYSINGSSDVEDSNGHYTANSLHYINAVHAPSWAREGDNVPEFYGDGSNYPNPDYAWRAELANSNTATALTPGEEWYYSLSFYPPSADWDIATQYSTVISQWKQYGGGDPNGEIRLSNAGDYKIFARSVRYDWGNTSGDGVHIGTAVPDAWNDLKFYIKHSHLDAEGVIKVWLNGELVFERSGKTVYSSSTQGYMKFGMYTEIRDERKLYYDAIRMSNNIGVPFEDWTQDQVHVPSITLDTPTNGENPTTGSDVILTVTADDSAGKKMQTPGSITQVEYFAGDNSIGIATIPPYSFIWNSPTDGAYDIKAVVTDADGNQATSEVATIRVGYFPPEVNITAPQHLGNLSAGVSTVISATATDIDGSITQVDFYINNTLAGTDTSSPYSFDWTPNDSGAYIIEAIATDTNGKSSFDQISVTVDAVIQTSSVVSIHDASIRETNPTSTGNWSRVDIYGRSPREGSQVGIFKFDISDYSSVEEISKAKLRLYTDSVDSGGAELTAFSATGDSWDEFAVTWNHPDRPLRGTALSGLNVTQSGIYYEFDVTSFLVDKHAAGATLVSFWIEDLTGSRNHVEFDSRTRPNVPLLEVTTSDIKTLTTGNTNHIPLSQDISSSTDQASAIGVILLASDTDDDILTYSIVNQPSNGSVSLTGTSATYTPNANFTGEDNFTYKSNDGIEDSNMATVTISVEVVLSVTENLFDNLLVHPNPSSNFIYLNTNYSLDYIIYNPIGQKISEGNTNYEIDISNLQSGVYYISFKKDSQTTIRKVIKN